jgi:hypothetical protein
VTAVDRNASGVREGNKSPSENSVVRTRRNEMWQSNMRAIYSAMLFQQVCQASSGHS